MIYLIIALGLFSALVSFRATRHEEAAEAAFPPEGQFLDVNGTRVHAVIMGEGPDLVLIHGSSGSTRDMTFSLAPKLASRYRVIVFDRPGLGYTDAINPQGDSIEDQARLLAAAAERLDATAPIVLGQSYGGSVALAWAVHRPDALSGLVLLAPAANPWTTPLDPLYRVTSTWWGHLFVVPIITAFVTDGYLRTAIAGIFAPQTAPDGYTTSVGAPLSIRRASLRATARQRANLLDEITAMVPAYGTIAVPTEIIHGTADTIVGLGLHSEPLLEQISDATLTPLDGVGHMPHHVAQDTVLDALERIAARAGLR